jgi:5-methylcytosine-specific restriction protein A
MPVRALKPCVKPGCGRLNCSEHTRDQQEERRRFDQGRAADPIRRLYFSAVWLTTRRIILFRDPICKICGVAFSTVADHKIPARKYVAAHGGDVESFFDESNLQGVCKSCHDAKTAKECGWAGRKEMNG